jgi:hypothetical protein
MRICHKPGCTTRAIPPLIVCDEHQGEFQSSVALRRPTAPLDEWRTKLVEDMDDVQRGFGSTGGSVIGVDGTLTEEDA